MLSCFRLLVLVFSGFRIMCACCPYSVFVCVVRIFVVSYVSVFSCFVCSCVLLSVYVVGTFVWSSVIGPHVVVICFAVLFRVCW